MAVTTIRPGDNKVIQIAENQVLSGSWADLGEVIDVKDIHNIALWLKLVIGDSADVQIRVMGMPTENSSDLYKMPITEVTATKVNISPEYFEITNDADDNLVFQIDTEDLLPFLQLQIKAGTPGASPGNATAGVSFEKTEC